MTPKIVKAHAALHDTGGWAVVLQFDDGSERVLKARDREAAIAGVTTAFQIKWAVQAIDRGGPLPRLH
jgi:hypothetical protein